MYIYIIRMAVNVLVYMYLFGLFYDYVGIVGLLSGSMAVGSSSSHRWRGPVYSVKITSAFSFEASNAAR